MDNLLAGLDKLGLNLDKFNNIYEEPEAKSVSRSEAEMKKTETVNEQDMIFEKTIQCPICGKSFKTKVVRTGKARLVGSDTDLKPVYNGFEPLKYDVIACTCCGYAATSKSFGHITPGQIKLIRDNIAVSFSGLNCNGDIYTFNDAIERYKLALANAIVMHGKNSEKAYLCLKLAWLYRSMHSGLPEDNPMMSKLRKEFMAEEKKYIQSAYEGFAISYSKEMPPICGMDIHTLTYLLADLGRRCEDYDNAKKLLGTLLTSKGVPTKLKERARDLKEMIYEDETKSHLG